MKRASSVPSSEGQVLIAPRNDDGKKIFRAVSEVARRLDISRSNVTSITELFDLHIEVQRIKLRDGCEKLLFAEPLLFGRKAQELLWRKTFYDVINTAKKLLTKYAFNEKDTDKLILHNHIDAGIGYYNYFLYRLQSEFDLDLNGIIDFPLKQIVDCTQLSSEVKRWAYICAHSCLISMGDLNRYKLEIDNVWGLMNAERYYKQAIYLDSRIGMPFNQLGTLSGSVNYHLDAVYFYIQCLLSPQPFDGAENNLKLIFEKNQSYVNNFKGKVDDDYAEHIKICISRFLYLFEIWIFNKTHDDINDLCHSAINDLKECILYLEPPSETYEDLVDGYTYLQKQNARRHPECLDGDIIFKISVICIMCVQKLQDISSSHVSLVKAFTLAILLELINFVNDNVEEFIYVEIEKLKNEFRNEFKNEPVEENTITADSNVLVTKENKELDMEKPIEKKVDSPIKRNNRRRRRRYYSDTSTDDHSSVSENDVENENNISSNEYDSDNDIIIEDIEELSPSLDIETSVKELMNRKPSKNGFSLNGDIFDNGIKNSKQEECSEADLEFEIVNGSLQENKAHDSNDDNADSKISLEDHDSGVKPSTDPLRFHKFNRRKHRLQPDEIIMFSEKEQVLNSIKILCDWLRGDVDLIKSCAKSSPTFIQRLVHLLNSLNIDIFSKYYRERFGKILNVNETKFEVEMLRETNEFVPLPEDHELRGLHILENSHFVLDWDYHKKLKVMCSTEECIYRILKLINFGFFLAKIKYTNVKFNSKNRYFMVRKEYKNTKKIKQKYCKLSRKRFKKATRNRMHSKKHFEELNFQDSEESEELIKHMGKLWLKSQVKDLEINPPIPKKPPVPKVRKNTKPPKNSKNKAITPYIVIDSKCLTQHSHKVRQIVMSKLSIVIIPKIVMNSLDMLKFESNPARDSIRWLEGQLLKGNRHLRGQRNKEQLPLHRITIPKKMEKDTQDYLQMLELCNYLATHGEEGTDCNGYSVTFLTGPDLSDFSSRDFSLTGLAKSANINVEKIAVFYAKCRHILAEIPR
ncbi:LOW QUALITY PROTEIN: protein SMG5-like [Ctenocephalides felis]|uniref:LOW QUALITY PROTEIN: protein SMG5-like n=1 Tax=Ctenocephalides felis TaxID=7515 RepID=UPI000E6E5530|nr:LOW QUALITY PROTEIN: protein SMG5-like [Ctenocephalides felis]